MLTFHSLRVAEIHPEAEDAVSVAVEIPSDLRERYRGHPGQHVVIRTDINDEENRRTYSVVSTPGESPLRIAVRVHSHGCMSRYLAEQLNVGDHLDVLPPNGSFTPRRTTPPSGVYVAFAAGCGITPVLAIIRSLLTTNTTSRAILFYGNTGSSRAMCLEELLALKDRHLGRLSLHFVMSREPQEVELYNGRIDGQRVREFARTLFNPTAVTEAFVCGPGNMIEEVSATLRELGIAADRIHGEHFTLATTAADESKPELIAARTTTSAAASLGSASPERDASVPARVPTVAGPGTACNTTGSAARAPVPSPAQGSGAAGAGALGSATGSMVSSTGATTAGAASTAGAAAGTASSVASTGGSSMSSAGSTASSGGSAAPSAGSVEPTSGSAAPRASSGASTAGSAPNAGSVPSTANSPGSRAGSIGSAAASAASRASPAGVAGDQAAAAASDESKVTILMDGRRRTFSMRMNDEVILDAAARAGLELPFSCRAGVCSTCRTKVTSGSVEMAQNYALEDWEVEEGYVLACQSRVTTPTLELDYDEK